MTIHLRGAGAVMLLLPLLLTACGGAGNSSLSQGTTPAASNITSYTALGDSITWGVGLAHPETQAYPALVAATRGWTLQNFGSPGNSACDVYPLQAAPHALSTVPATGTAYSLLIGSNDADNMGVGPYEAVFKQCHAAMVTWLATRPQDKIFPGDTSVTTSGTCTNRSSDGYFLCGGVGSLSVPQFTSTGNPLYVWYTISDTAPANASFTVTADGKSTIAFSRQATAIKTANNTRVSIGLLRIAPFNAGTRTVQISTVAGGLSILAIGTNRAVKPVPVAIGDVPNQLLSAPMSPVSTQLAYTAHVRENMADAVADGLDVRIADDRNYMLGTSDQLQDQVHPNALGQQLMSKSFLAALP